MTDLTVLEDTMVKPFATLMSCRDTVGSECVRGVTLEECVDQCRTNPFCACGYFLQPSDTRQKSYCAPLNSALLKNMNLLLNIYDHDTDPHANLWSKTAVFYDPNIYPPLDQQPQDYILMEKDICNLVYTTNDSKDAYYLQNDLSWKKDAASTAMLILFIDKYPQFYELANNVQAKSNVVFKIFAQPEVLSVDKKGMLEIQSYLTSVVKVPDFYMYIPSPSDSSDSIDMSVLSIGTPFQIMLTDPNQFLGVRSRSPTNGITIGTIPFHGQNKEFTGHFSVSRQNIQPNIFQVAKALPARDVFLQDSVLPASSSFRWAYILLALAIVLLIVAILWINKPMKEYSCPDAKIACYDDKPQDVNCQHSLTKIKTHPSNGLLSCKITKEQGNKVCKNGKYWICNLDQLL